MIKGLKNIAIVCGGDSSEHDVSMRSAKGLYSFFDKTLYNVFIADVKKGDWHVDLEDGTTASIDRNDFSFSYNGEHVKFDYAYITIHGTPGENGLFQGYLELLGIPYSTSNVLVEALTFDKYVLNNYLRNFGVNVADSILLRKDDKTRPSAQEIADRLGVPCFVKPTADGSSYGVTKVKSIEEIDSAIAFAFEENDEVMVEALMTGVEISQGCYKTREKSVVFPATEVVSYNEFFDYDAKYNGQVDEITPARIKSETAKRVADETLRIYNLLHCNGIIRIDYILTPLPDGTDLINMIEINTTPGMTATSFIPQQVRAAGLDISKVLTEIVENNLNR